ncbi:hypothetical protein NE236_30220 [Actinoallomurus purpureus]|uniref:DUF6406 domain-containing protein n=1 Tax=Actinoallomurus purpureus TaxID=478114 RepID=UPI00209358B0|nr:DUF6406 domain-containing protein [Actinoallomurus purpureus]MCO6009255.1 hypothetical protein [Actinoallomurus purpureus]
MTSDLPGTIELHQSIPHPLEGGTVIGGSSYLDDQGRLEVRLAIKDDAGERRIRHHEGDTFEFAGATWRVTKVFEAYPGGRPRVATLSKIE